MDEQTPHSPPPVLQEGDTASCLCTLRAYLQCHQRGSHVTCVRQARAALADCEVSGNDRVLRFVIRHINVSLRTAQTAFSNSIWRPTPSDVMAQDGVGEGGLCRPQRDVERPDKTKDTVVSRNFAVRECSSCLSELEVHRVKRGSNTSVHHDWGPSHACIVSYLGGATASVHHDWGPSHAGIVLRGGATASVHHGGHISCIVSCITCMRVLIMIVRIVVLIVLMVIHHHHHGHHGHAFIVLEGVAGWGATAPYV